MRCFVCGGEIHLKTPCTKCKIEYDEMITKIEHPEIRKLIKKLEEHQNNHSDNSYEASLLACELENSSLIFPAVINDEGLGIMNIFDEKGKAFLPLFTDLKTFNEFSDELYPLTNTFDMILKLVDNDTEGIVINVNDECCSLSSIYINNFFR